MSENENNYIPRFERDLMKAGGDLSALAEQKKAEEQSVPEEETPAETPVEEVPEEELPDIEFVYGDDDYDSSKPLAEIAAGVVLDDMASGVKLEEMRTERSALATSLKNQMIADDLAMEIQAGKLEEMSTEYGNDNIRKEDILAKDYLDKNDREALKNRTMEALSAKPKGFSQKKSMEMAKKLMHEQKAKEAKKGFVMLLLVALVGLVSAGLAHYLDMNSDGTKPYMDYIPIAGVVFSLFALVRSRFSRVLSVVYFAVQTAALMYGLIAFTLAPDSFAGEGYILKLVLFVLAIGCSAFVGVKIVTGKKIGVYYSFRK
ncbi:MAG: chloride channel protein [Ruminococcus sp.]|nr:chloride channel protein [Ruminococcus sp.]MCM1382503.1 chloride channel protein [Muribaculaceae bacterium]MCM1480124.1 chloride channel protein [Muribaculaceae bacterium]